MTDSDLLVEDQLDLLYLKKKEFDYNRFQIAKFYESVDYQITNKPYKKASKRIKEGRAWIQVIITCMHEQSNKHRNDQKKNNFYFEEILTIK